MPGDDQGRAAWERQAATWARRVRAGEDFYRDAFNTPAFLAFLPEVAGLEVLDLGCGEGTMARVLARRGARITGIDLSEAMIALARDEETTCPLGIRYQVDDLSKLTSLDDGSFDLAISTMALMNCSNLAAAIAAVARVLEPGGGLAFSVLHPCFVTPGIGWVGDDDGAEAALTVSGYFAEDPVMERLTFDKEANETAPIEVPRFPHRLEHYVGGLVAGGFEILKLAEPRPSEAAATAFPKLQRWRRDAALFLHLAAAKKRA